MLRRMLIGAAALSAAIVLWDRFTGSRRPKPAGADDRQHGQYGGLVSPDAGADQLHSHPQPGHGEHSRGRLSRRLCQPMG